jgi:WD repeat-containing protein 26
VLLQAFDGFAQAKFVLRPCFAGPEEELVLIGSEDGQVHVWSKTHATRLGQLAAHAGAVNAVVADPLCPSRVLTAGDDGKVMFWDLRPQQGF